MRNLWYNKTNVNTIILPWAECLEGIILGPTDLIHTKRSVIMKKSLVVATLFIAAVVLIVSVSVGSKGAVKVEFEPNVGWVILNTTASGKLNATVHLDDGIPNEDFMINVRIRYEDGSVEELVNIATLSTNGEGKGNLRVQVNITPPADSNILRRVAFRARRPGPPNVLYLAVAWDVPLK